MDSLETNINSLLSSDMGLNKPPTSAARSGIMLELRVLKSAISALDAALAHLSTLITLLQARTLYTYADGTTDFLAPENAPVVPTVEAGSLEDGAERVGRGSGSAGSAGSADSGDGPIGIPPVIWKGPMYRKPYNDGAPTFPTDTEQES